MRHDGLALGGHFADALSIRIQDAKLNSRQRLANRVSAKRFQIVHGEHSPRFSQAVTVRHGNSKIVKELKRRWIYESAASEHGKQFSSKGLVNLR